MDSQKKRRIVISAGVGAAVLLVLGGLLAIRAALSKQIHFLSASLRVDHIVATYEKAWDSVQKKVEDLRTADEQNRRLKFENARLLEESESGNFKCRSTLAADATKNIELKLNKETGARVGRSLAGLSYRPPDRLLPAQLYTLGMTYFRSGEHEKSAVILTELTGAEDLDVYKTAKNYLAAGVSWYRLDNYVLADYYFDEVLKKQESSETLQFQAQARLWKALVSKRLRKEEKVQYWLKDLLDHHPQAAETSWINPQEVERETASEE